MVCQTGGPFLRAAAGGQLTGQFAIDVRSGPGGSTHRNYPDGYVITGSQAQLVRFFTRTEGDVQDAG